MAIGVVRVLRKIEIAMSGRNSPTAPIALIARPKGESSSRASRRIGISVPSAVELRAIPITTIPSPGAKKKPRPMPSITLSSHPSDARASGLPATFVKSISVPATKNSSARPKSLSFSSSGPVSTQPRTAGPMRMPRTSSNTTIGTRTTGRTPRASRGAATASRGTSTRPRSLASMLSG